MVNASGDLDTSGLSDTLAQMTSAVAQLGFSFFTNQIAPTVPTLSATLVPGRGLAIDKARQDYTSSSGSCLDMKPETHEELLKWYNIILPTYWLQCKILIENCQIAHCQSCFFFVRMQ